VSKFHTQVAAGLPDYTTTTGHKLFPQGPDDKPQCVWCGAPPQDRRSDCEGVFYCSHEHWRLFCELPEWKELCADQRAELESVKTRLTQWREKGWVLRAHGNANMWEQADWLLAGDGFGLYKEAAEILDFTVGTCRVVACVAKAFPPAERDMRLRFGHHQAVASVEPTERRALLDRAVAEKLSVGKLRVAVRKLKALPSNADEPVSKTARLAVIIELNTWFRQATDIAFKLSFSVRKMTPEQREQVRQKLLESAAYITDMAATIEKAKAATVSNLR
jgi:hypothetical protein